MNDDLVRRAQVQQAEQRIAWIETHPAFSEWLKHALRTGLARDPVEVMNDLEILHHLLGRWATASIEQRRHDRPK